jgi:glycosyltransferase involved in cell wall biosynthesis
MMPGIYASSDVIVNYPSNDAFPSTLVEAVACGRPVLTVDLPGYRGTFIEKYCTLVAPKQPVALAEAMVKMVNRSPSEHTAHLAEARQVIIEQYDERLAQERLFQLYQDLATQR